MSRTHALWALIAFACSNETDPLVEARDATVAQLDASSADASEADLGVEAPDAGVIEDDAGVAPISLCLPPAPTVRSVERQALAVDRAGNVHLAIGGDALYYGFLPFNGTSFAVELVDAHGGPASLLLDENGNPAVAYWDRSYRRTAQATEVEGLKLARKNGSGWNIHVLDAERRRVDVAALGIAPAFALAADMFYFAYGSPDSQLILGTFDGATYSHMVYDRLSPFSDVHGDRIEIGVDLAGQPMVAFSSDYTLLNLVRSTRGEWGAPELVLHDNETIEWSFFVDAEGHPGFVIERPESGVPTEVWRHDGALWRTLACPGYESSTDRAALLPDGTPAFVAYGYPVGMEDWQYVGVVETSSTCTFDQVIRRRAPEPGVLPIDPRSSFAAGGTTRAIATLDQTSGSVLTFVSFDQGATYTQLTVQESRLSGLVPEIDVLADGSPVIVSMEGVRGALELATWNRETAAFEVEEVPLEGCTLVAVGAQRAIDLLVLGTGDILVVYFRTCGQDIAAGLAQKTSSGWEHSSLRAAPPYALGFQPNGEPTLSSAFAVFERTDGAWRAASLPETSFAYEPEVDFAYDTEGRLVVAQKDQSTILISLRETSGSWSTERFELPPSVNNLLRYPIELEIDRTGRYHLTHGRHDEDGDGVLPNVIDYAQKDSLGWTRAQIDEVSASDYLSFFTGLDMQPDANDRPVIVYHSSVDAALELAAATAEGTFTFRTLDTDGDTGFYPTLALDGDIAHVAHHRASTGDLCYQRFSIAEGR